MLQACPLNPHAVPLSGAQEALQDFSARFSPAIRGVVQFAKRLPGFALLAQADQVTLLKAGVFEVLLLRLAAMFDAQVKINSNFQTQIKNMSIKFKSKKKNYRF